MKILIASRAGSAAHGGSAFHLRNMISALGGHDISEVLFPNGGYDDPLSKQELNEMDHAYWDIKPDVVIADYSWMCDAFDIVLSDVIKICFVHDLRCRIIPCLTAIGYRDAQEWTKEKEAVLLRKADVLLVLNDDDAAFCRRMAPDAKIIHIGISMAPVEHDPTKEIDGRCIYVGSHNMENLWAINWFEREVWPKVLAKVPHATLDKVWGHPDDIEQHYAEAQIAVVPHIMNGGLKIKTAEAFAHEIPVVGNVCAFDGINDAGYKKNIATDDPQKMVNLIIQLLVHSELREALRCRFTSHCAEHMTPRVAYDGLLQVLNP